MINFYVFTYVMYLQIFIRLLENRPSSKNFFSSEALQQWTRATHVRLRFIRTKTLLGHLMSLSRQDSSVTRRVGIFIKHELNLIIIELHNAHFFVNIPVLLFHQRD